MNLTVENLSFTYPGAKTATLDNINFRAEGGEVTSIIGANGVGKTTLLKAIMNFFNATGKVLFGNTKASALNRRELMRHVSYMTQESGQVSPLTVLDTVLLGRVESLQFKVSDEELDKAWKVLELLNIGYLAIRPLNKLSGGQRRVVNIAQAIVREPDLLIMDEPTANLDMQNQMEILELVREYTKQRQITTILTLHDLNMAARYSDKLLLLKEGRVFHEGPPKLVIQEDIIKSAYGVEVHVGHDQFGVPMLHPIASVRKQSYVFTKKE